MILTSRHNENEQERLYDLRQILRIRTLSPGLIERYYVDGKIIVDWNLTGRDSG